MGGVNRRPYGGRGRTVEPTRRGRDGVRYVSGGSPFGGRDPRQVMAERTREMMDSWERAGRRPYAPPAGLPGHRALGESGSVNGHTTFFGLFAGETLLPEGPYV